MEVRALGREHRSRGVSERRKRTYRKMTGERYQIKIYGDLLGRRDGF